MNYDSRKGLGKPRLFCGLRFGREMCYGFGMTSKAGKRAAKLKQQQEGKIKDRGFFQNLVAGTIMQKPRRDVKVDESDLRPLGFTANVENVVLEEKRESYDIRR